MEGLDAKSSHFWIVLIQLVPRIPNFLVTLIGYPKKVHSDPMYTRHTAGVQERQGLDFSSGLESPFDEVAVYRWVDVQDTI